MRDPEAFSLLFSYPLEVYVRENEDDPSERRTVETAEEFAELLAVDWDDWHPEDRLVIVDTQAPQIYLNSTYDRSIHMRTVEVAKLNGTCFDRLYNAF